MNYTYCINVISEIISIYKELIDLLKACKNGKYDNELNTYDVLLM